MNVHSSMGSHLLNLLACMIVSWLNLKLCWRIYKLKSDPWVPSASFYPVFPDFSQSSNHTGFANNSSPVYPPSPCVPSSVWSFSPSCHSSGLRKAILDSLPHPGPISSGKAPHTLSWLPCVSILFALFLSFPLDCKCLRSRDRIGFVGWRRVQWLAHGRHSICTGSWIKRKILIYVLFNMWL